MFINIKLSKIFKIFFILVVILMIIFFFISVYRIYSKTSISTNSISTSNLDVVDLTTRNYTNALKAVHENIDSYVRY